jgi:glycosyltransferase involved in cell wall biosynthesis
MVFLLSDGALRARLQQAGVWVRVLRAGRRMMQVRRETRRPSLLAAGEAVGVGLRLVPCARRFDVVYANSQKAFVAAAVAAPLARRPLIWHLRDILSSDHFSYTNVRLVVRLANWLASRVIANSRATAEAFIGGGGDARKVRVVYGGVDPAPFDAVEAIDVGGVRRALGVGAAPLVGVFSRFHPWKGQHVVVEALARVPGAHAVFAGDALFGEQEYVEAVARRAGELRVSDRVHLLGFRPDVPRLMRAMDLVVHPSVGPEPFGRAIVEAMLAGRAVVATRAGGAPEILQHEVTGLLVAPGDPIGLADALAALLQDAPRREAMGRAGADSARRRFSLAGMLAGVAREIEEVTRQ